MQEPTCKAPTDRVRYTYMPFCSYKTEMSKYKDTTILDTCYFNHFSCCIYVRYNLFIIILYFSIYFFSFEQNQVLIYLAGEVSL